MIRESLLASRVRLDLPASSHEEAVETVLSLLQGDPDVPDFAELKAAVKTRAASALPGSPILIAHGRTNAVRKFVLAAGRLAAEAADPSPLRLVFVAGIPSTMNSDYLRAVGAIARICSHPSQLAELLEVPTQADFISCLQAAEA